MGRVYVIIVNWNGYRDTIECLESLARLRHANFRVVIVDNGSTDGSIEALRRWTRAEPRQMAGPVWDRLPASRRVSVSLEVVSPDGAASAETEGLQVTLIAAGENLGFAGANNLGMRFAIQDRAADFFWLLNNDTVVTPNALSALLAYAAANPSKGMIGSVLLYYRDPDTVQGLGGWLRPGQALAGHIGAGTRRKPCRMQAW